MRTRTYRYAALVVLCTIGLLAAAAAPVAQAAPLRDPGRAGGPPQAAGQAAVARYVTLPADFPRISITQPAQDTAEGLLFFSTFDNWSYNPSFILITDNAGEPVYYQRSPRLMWDLEVLPDGRLVYADYDHYVIMDNTYTVVDTYRAGHGFPTDLHDFRLLPNGHALVLGRDVHENVDLSQIVPGGNTHAQVIGVIIEELDAAHNVVFEWRGWDHFQITDSYIPLTTALVDYVHANSVEPDEDGNLLLSSRYLDEVTKIDRQTGEIMWRLGGKNNQFTFSGDSPPYFHAQHDVRRLPNHNLTLFDNRTDLAPAYSRAVEYQLDETAKTASLVWQYRNVPDTYAIATGNVQRFPNGNTLVGWGTAGVITEVTPDGAKAFEANFPYYSYRALRFPWHARPAADPALVAQQDAGGITLTYSWNGATDIAAYRVYEGPGSPNLTLIETRARAGFETQTVVPNNSQSCRYFRVLPIDTHGQATRFSNRAATCPQMLLYLPTLVR